MSSKIIIYIDGGSRGNPGPAAIAMNADLRGLNPDLRGQKEYSKFIGKTTNNVAEYEAAIFALKKLKQLIGKKKAREAEIEIRSDSSLLVSQLNGQFKLKEKDLIPLFVEIWNLKPDFGSVSFVQVPREENKRADKLVNQELNNQKGLF